jgi:hypothetical protein
MNSTQPQARHVASVPFGRKRASNTVEPQRQASGGGGRDGGSSDGIVRVRLARVPRQ